MQKIFSTRLEESVIDEMDRAVRRLGISKKRFLEEAIHARAEQVQAESEGDVWSETMGAWKRKAVTERTVESVRRAFQRSMLRHQSGEDARVRR